MIYPRHSILKYNHLRAANIYHDIPIKRQLFMPVQNLFLPLEFQQTKGIIQI